MMMALYASPVLRSVRFSLSYINQPPKNFVANEVITISIPVKRAVGRLVGI